MAECFPDANPKKLERWLDRVTSETSVEPEPLLFAAFICAVQFRIAQPDIHTVLAEIYSWLTEYPRSMKGELAELVIAAIEPGMSQAVTRMGWHKGILDGPYVRKKGAPPKTRGAWVAGLIVDSLLRQGGQISRLSL